MKFDAIVENPQNANTTGKTLYQGLAKLTPVAVNPTKEQLSKLLGAELTNDINYENGENYRLDFWCKEVTTEKLLKFSIFIGNKEVTSKNGMKHQYINAYGKTEYFESKEAIDAKNASATEDWRKFKTDGLRIAKVGEATLYSFLIALYNASPTTPFPQFDSFQKLTVGALGELRDVIQDASTKERVVHALVGVKDGKYQDIWTQRFLPAVFTEKAEMAFFKKAADAEYPYKADWGNDLAFRVYNPEQAPTDKLEVEASSSAAPDDLPW